MVLNLGFKILCFIYVTVVIGTSLVSGSVGGYRSYGNGPYRKDHVLAEELQSHFDNGDIIDLDETTFDEALAKQVKPSSEKYGEDTREARLENDGKNDTIIPWNENRHSASDEISFGKGELVAPVQYLSDTEEDGAENVTSQYVTSDDEDLTSGSGSGNIVIEIEDGSQMINGTVGEENVTGTNGSNTDQQPSNDQSWTIRNNAKRVENETENTRMQKDIDGNNMPPFCEELSNVTWSPWSPWLQAGDVDIRFRSCPIEHMSNSIVSSCDGDYFEIRPCVRSGEKMCRTSGGDITEEYNVTCKGMDVNDMQNVDELKNPSDRTDNCEYTLYDLKYDMAIGEPKSTDQLQTADPNMWCFADDKFVPFYTPTQRCLNNLKAFCKSRQTCKYLKQARASLKNKGDLHKTCWEDFVLGGLLPEGFPDNGGHQMICQRFDKESKLGKVLGHKIAHYSTLYDTRKRIPVISMVTVRVLGDDKWPEMPFMVERGLIEDEGSLVTWFFKDRKKGMAKLDEIASQSDNSLCRFGQKQAMKADYDYSGYRTVPLLTPDIIGNDIGRRLSTFTLTNTAPMEPSVYSGWKNALKAVRKFAIEKCHIPVNFDKEEEKRHRNGHELPELYLQAGAACSSNHMEVIGNDVTVPELFWLAACCAHGAEVSSFGIYAYNRFEQKPVAVSIENLQMLLQSSFYNNVDVIKINLYPAFNGVCTAAENDVSFQIHIP